MRARAKSPDIAALPVATSALAVVAHPDDESFGLGAVLSGLAHAGVRVRVLCFTHGEASTLGCMENLGDVRSAELGQAAAELGVDEVTLLNHPDGHLNDVPWSILDGAVEEHLTDADLVIAFESGGVTGHCDHRAATAAAQRVAARHQLRLLEWGVAPEVADALNRELGTAFVATGGMDVLVDRAAQLAAIACHLSQARDNPVLRLRLELEGGRERIRVTRPATGRPDVTA